MNVRFGAVRAATNNSTNIFLSFGVMVQYRKDEKDKAGANRRFFFPSMMFCHPEAIGTVQPPVVYLAINGMFSCTGLMFAGQLKKCIWSQPATKSAKAKRTTEKHRLQGFETKQTCHATFWIGTWIVSSSAPVCCRLATGAPFWVGV